MKTTAYPHRYAIEEIAGVQIILSVRFNSFFKVKIISSIKGHLQGRKEWEL
jgi:hypothetical protein